MEEEHQKSSIAPHGVRFTNLTEAVYRIKGVKPDGDFEMKDMGRNDGAFASSSMPQSSVKVCGFVTISLTNVDNHSRPLSTAQDFELSSHPMFKQLKESITRTFNGRTPPPSITNLEPLYEQTQDKPGKPYNREHDPFTLQSTHKPGSSATIKGECHSSAINEADTYDQQWLHNAAGTPKAKYSAGKVHVQSVNEGSTIDAFIGQYSSNVSKENLRRMVDRSNDRTYGLAVTSSAKKTNRPGGCKRAYTTFRSPSDQAPAVIPGSDSFIIGNRTGPATTIPSSDVFRYGNGETLTPIAIQKRKLVRNLPGKAPESPLPMLPTDISRTHLVADSTTESASYDNTGNLLDITCEGLNTNSSPVHPDTTSIDVSILSVRSNTNPFRRAQNATVHTTAHTDLPVERTVDMTIESSFHVQRTEHQVAIPNSSTTQCSVSKALHRQSVCTDEASNYAISTASPVSPLSEITRSIQPAEYQDIVVHDHSDDDASLRRYLNDRDLFTPHVEPELEAQRFYADDTIPSIWRDSPRGVRVAVMQRQDSYDIIGISNGRTADATMDRRNTDEGEWETVGTSGPAGASNSSQDYGDSGMQRASDSIAGLSWDPQMENQEFDAPTRDLASFSSRERILTHPTDQSAAYSYREREIVGNGGPGIPIRLPVYNNPYSLRNSNRPMASLSFTDSPYLEDQEYANLENRGPYAVPRLPSQGGACKSNNTRNLTLQFGSSSDFDRAKYNHSPEGYIEPTIRKVHPSLRTRGESRITDQGGLEILQRPYDESASAVRDPALKKVGVNAGPWTPIRRTNLLHATVRGHLNKRVTGPLRLQEFNHAHSSTAFSTERKQQAQRRMLEINHNVTARKMRPLSKQHGVQPNAEYRVDDPPRMTVDGHEYARRIDPDKFVTTSPKSGIINRAWRHLYEARQLAEIDGNAANPPMTVDNSGVPYPTGREIIIPGPPKLSPVPVSSSDFTTHSNNGYSHKISLITLCLCTLIPFMLAAFGLGWLDALVPCLTSNEHTRMKTNHKRWAWIILVAEAVIAVVIAIMAGVVYRLQHH